MNSVNLMGRLTNDPKANDAGTVTRYTLAVDRRFKREGEPTADFVSCVVFGKPGEFASKFLRKGMKIAVTGRIQTGSYTNKDGAKVYTTDVVVESQEFAEPKKETPEDRMEKRETPEDFSSVPNWMVPNGL